MMVIGSLKVTLRASWVQSLKEKRAITKRIISKVRHKFNVSIHEVEQMDVHHTIVIGVSCVSNSKQVAQSVLDQLINYIESQTDAELTEIELDLL